MSLREFTIAGGQVLTPDGLIDTSIVVAGTTIAAVGASSTRGSVIRADGLRVLPGMVDLHGDAFERQWMPRPQVRFPLDVALSDTDRQLATNGITTAFHGVTWSWEGGLRGGASAKALIDAIHAHRGRYAVDHRVHLRFENHNVAEGPQVAQALADGRVHFLAFNDHLDDIARKCEQQPAKRASYAERADASDEAFMQRLEAARAQRDEVDATIADLARIARRHDIAMASHDDLTDADRERYAALGAEVAEFPRSMQAIDAARRLGSTIVLGTPNVVRGGSHCGAVDAAAMARLGCCDVLTSDYYYPALLHAPFRLAHDHGIDFASAWRMVSAHPARAARLHDRGEIAANRRADLLLIDAASPHGPRVVGCFVAGRAVYLAQAEFA